MMNPVSSPQINVTEILATHVINTRFEDFEKVDVDNAKNRLIDVIGCAIGGCQAPGNESLFELIKEMKGKGEASVWLHHIKVPLQNAAMFNSVMARSFDFEVMAGLFENQVFSGHHAASIIPTAIAVGELNKASGKEMLSAVLIADDLTARILVAGGGIPVRIGWDGTMLFSNWGTTAAAGRLLRLNETQMKHAFGIAVNMMAGCVQSLWDGATTFKFQGMADFNGIFAARLAQKGWTGVLDPLLGRFGFFNLYFKGCKDPDALTRNLGKKFWGEIYYKPYPGGMPNHAAIGAALALVNKHPIDINNIKEIVIHVPPDSLSTSYYAKPFTLREYPLGDAIFSYPYTVASTLVKKSMGLPNFTDAAIRDPEINALTAKTKLIEQPASQSPGTAGIVLQVIMNDGQEFTESKGPVREWVTTPITREQVIKKYWHQVDFTRNIAKTKAEKILDLVLNLEQVKDIATLIKLLS
jgi:2-methylcitrate dehydratase